MNGIQYLFNGVKMDNVKITPMQKIVTGILQN